MKGIQERFVPVVETLVEVHWLVVISRQFSVQSMVVQCSWDGYNARKKRGELLFADIRGKHADSEAFRRLLLEYHQYSHLLESQLESYIQTLPLKDVTDFRAHRPKDPDDLMGLSLSLENLDIAQEAEYEFDESESPINILSWQDKLAVRIFFRNQESHSQIVPAGALWTMLSVSLQV